MTIELSSEESRYLLKNLNLAREYYGQLALNSRCSVDNRYMHELVETIAAKLGDRAKVFNP